jgi:hypothetical protein
MSTRREEMKGAYYKISYLTDYDVKRWVLALKQQAVFFAASSSMNRWRIRKLKATAASFVYLIDIKEDLRSLL